MAARYTYYLLSDSAKGKEKELELSQIGKLESTTHGNIRHGFVCERVPHIMLSDIANDVGIDVIWEEKQPAVEAALAELNAVLRGHETAFEVETGGARGEEGGLYGEG